MRKESIALKINLWVWFILVVGLPFEGVSTWTFSMYIWFILSWSIITDMPMKVTVKWEVWSMIFGLFTCHWPCFDQHTILADFLHILMHQPHAPAPGLVFIYVTGHKTLHFLFATFLSMLNLWSFHYFFLGYGANYASAKCSYSRSKN